jgi:hypothetical protein
LKKENAVLSEAKSKLEIEVGILQNTKETLENENKSLKDELKTKNRLVERFSEVARDREEQSNKLTTLLTEATEKIERLITNGGVSPTEAPKDPDRPKIGDAYIDPAEEMGEVESHIKTENVASDEKEKTDKKVEKLKGLLGKLPNSK